MNLEDITKRFAQDEIEIVHYERDSDEVKLILKGKRSTIREVAVDIGYMTGYTELQNGLCSHENQTAITLLV